MSREKLQWLKFNEQLGDNMGEDAVCDYPGCNQVGEIISRLSRGLLSSNWEESLLV